MENQLFIPPKLKVGFDEREDTYTGQLAYIIYFDAKGKLRRETSWEGWRDKEIAPVEYDNVPTEGFVLNKQVGGGRCSYSWNARMEKVRVFDPRGFEFEITTENLLFILQEATSTKGKGLEGNFVYSWPSTGQGPVLIPCDCEEYRKSQNYTTGLSGKVSKKDLVPGCVYLTKKQEEMVYIGNYNYAQCDYSKFTVTKGNVFWRKISKGKSKHGYEIQLNEFECLEASKLSSKVTDVPVDNFAELMDLFNSSHFCPTMKNIHLIKAVEIKDRGYYYRGEDDLGNGFFIKTAPDTYQAYNIKVICKSDNYSYTGWKIQGYRMKPIATVTFDDNDNISVKYQKGSADPKLYSIPELNAMNIKTINVKNKHGKGAEYLLLKV